MTCELILGGARSGKSRLAEQRAADDGRPVTIVVTAEALDAEMAARIARHRADRPAHWHTVEAPRELAATLLREAAAGRCVVVDCVSMWLANLLAGVEELPEPLDTAALPLLQQERAALLETLPRLPGRVLLVANEVGFGLVPATPLGRLFRDEAGRLNQQLAALCARVSLVAAGLAVDLKRPGQNVEAVRQDAS
jgi:adenosylcobinamide kinase/adenosylcobinamide-phosphate guanylyltransferase